MIDGVLADLVVVVHGAFVLFVVLGGFIVWRWRWIVWLHAPAAAWGVLIEIGGWICPLTPLENALRARAGGAGYGGGFVEHYLLRALYPAGLTRQVQFSVAAIVVVINAFAYGRLLYRRRPRTAVR